MYRFYTAFHELLKWLMKTSLKQRFLSNLKPTNVRRHYKMSMYILYET